MGQHGSLPRGQNTNESGAQSQARTRPEPGQNQARTRSELA